jgi:branched-chain amino acid transport system ATP-binding protein
MPIAAAPVRQPWVDHLTERSVVLRWEVFRIVQQMKAEGISVLLVEQNARMSLEIADDAYVLDDGAVVYTGSARELAADDARVRTLAGASAVEWTSA